MSPILHHLFVASLRHSRLATALSLLAIALGVALGFAVQLIHSAALDEFGKGLRRLAGEADMQVTGPRSGFDDALYTRLAGLPGVADLAPVLEIEVRLPGRPQTLRMFGVDVLRAHRLHAALQPQADPAVGARDDFAMFAPDAVFLSAAAITSLSVVPGDSLSVQTGSEEHTLHVAGSVPGAPAGQSIAVMDVAAMQQVFARVGTITRVDLRIEPGVDSGEMRRALNAMLPPGTQILTPDIVETQALSLSRAYRVNLTMLAAIALVTGAFLVFSSQRLAVARRAGEFAFLRAMGMTRRELMTGILLEGAVLGFVGGAAGLVLGYALARIAVLVVGADLGAGYFENVQPAIALDPLSAALYLLAGTVSGVLGAWVPAREAGCLQPADGLRSAGDPGVLPTRPRTKLALASTALAAGLCMLPPVAGIPLFGYGAVALILAAAVLILPSIALLARGVPAPSRSVLLRLAGARLTAAPGQAVVAAAGVVASVALAAAMGIMVSSFRQSLDDWLAVVLPADLYVSASRGVQSAYLSESVIRDIAALPEVAQLRPVRFDTLRLDATHYPVTLIARPVEGGKALPLVRVASSSAAGEVPVWISEAVEELFSMHVGDEVALPIGGRRVLCRVAGVWRDYARQHGAVVIELDDYRRLTSDLAVNDLGIWIKPGATIDRVASEVRGVLGELRADIALPGEIRRRSLAIFDRTFLVTYLMEAVAVVIGLFGVSTSFAALVAARRKEFGMLRHLGLTRREVGRLLALEGVLTATGGTAVGLLAGIAVSVVLIEVVNRQSFHWSMDIQIPYLGLSVFAIMLVVLAALAATLSGRRAMQQSAVLAVREDW